MSAGGKHRQRTLEDLETSGHKINLGNQMEFFNGNHLSD
jgi:hypothetical protein